MIIPEHSCKSLMMYRIWRWIRVNRKAPWIQKITVKESLSMIRRSRWSTIRAYLISIQTPWSSAIRIVRFLDPNPLQRSVPRPNSFWRLTCYDGRCHRGPRKKFMSSMNIKLLGVSSKLSMRSSVEVDAAWEASFFNTSLPSLTSLVAFANWVIKLDLWSWKIQT